MKKYQHDFIQFAIQNNALLFGDFTLKSGRKSPYFFNSGQFADGSALYQLGNFYADAIIEHFDKTEYNILFGPAYKGIQLATVTSVGLHQKGISHVPVCYNRKEEKNHGEGGILVGCSLKDKKIILIDDVISAGTTIRQIVPLIQQAQGKLVGIVIALDRQEKGVRADRSLPTEFSAIQEVEQEFKLKVASIIKLQHMIDYLKEASGKNVMTQSHLKAILAYQQQFGV